MVIVGLLMLLAAIGIGLSGVLANSGSEHLLGQDFNVLGLQLGGLTTGQLFLYGIIIGVVGMLGLSLLLGIVLSMIGIFRGLEFDALALARAPGADLWVVESGTRGPFAEASRVPGDTREAVARIGGVVAAGSRSIAATT